MQADVPAGQGRPRGVEGDLAYALWPRLVAVARQGREVSVDFVLVPPGALGCRLHGLREPRVAGRLAPHPPDGGVTPAGDFAHANHLSALTRCGLLYGTGFHRSRLPVS